MPRPIPNRPRAEQPPTLLMGVALLTGATLMALAAYFGLYFGIATAADTLRLMLVGQTQTGVVLAHGEDNAGQYLAVELTATNPTRVYVPDTLYNRYRNGATVSVRIDPADPSRTALTEQLTLTGSVFTFGLAFFTAAPGLIFALIALWLLLNGLLNLTDVWRLQAGPLTTGTVTQRWVEPGPGRTTECCLAVAFETPTGRIIKALYVAPDLYARLKPGDPLPVRYSPRNPRIARFEG